MSVEGHQRIPAPEHCKMAFSQLVSGLAVVISNQIPIYLFTNLSNPADTPGLTGGGLSFRWLKNRFFEA